MPSSTRTCPAHDSLHTVTDGHNLAASDEDQFVLHRGCAEKVPGEDCLRLNVWTPEINGSHSRPVMVFMHGGGYSAGCGHDLLAYDGESMARRHDTVIVNHNHRLNVYGYLNLAEIGGPKYAASANVGLLDLVAVLEWVRDNIASFGGNPGNVTIFGQSGGGGKVINLMAMPSAKGLFHRAIVQSGPFLQALSPDYSGRLAAEVLRKLNVAKTNLDDLQQVPVDRLSWAAAEALKAIDHPQQPLRQTFGDSGWGPTVDGVILPRHPFDPAAPAFSAEVPLLTGTNLNEFVSGLDHPGIRQMSEADLTAKVTEGLGRRAAAVIAAYRAEYPAATPFDLYATIAAATMRRPSVEQARRKAAQGRAPAYAYLYAWRTPVLDGRPGPFHAAEIAYAMDNGELCDHYSGSTPEGLTLSAQMGAAWAAFARSGNPNHANLPFWPEYSASAPATMIFDTPCSVKIGLEAKGLELIAQA